MKRVALLLLLPLVAAGASRSAAAQTTGAESPSAAIQRFLAAARVKDLPKMADMWGTAKGPAGKNMSKRELERRELIMIQCLPHEQVTVGAPAPSEAGRLRIPVELTLRTQKAKPVFTVVRGPGNRWYVENFEIDQLRDQGFCGASAESPPPPPSARP